MPPVSPLTGKSPGKTYGTAISAATVSNPSRGVKHDTSFRRKNRTFWRLTGINSMIHFFEPET
jgi:hypothetical protein